MTHPDFTRAQLVIYDFDGTVAYTFADIAAAANHALRSLRREELSLETITSYVGHGIRNLMHRCLNESADEATLDKAVAAFRTYAFAHPADNAVLYDGMEELLDTLREKGVLQIILSNKNHELTNLVAKALRLERWCAEIIGETPQFPRKPDPTIVKDILARYDIHPADAAIVGDGDTDMQVGRAAGMMTCGATWGLHTREELEAFGAEWVVDSPKELLHMFCPSPRT